MMNSDPWPSPYQCSYKPKLCAVYIFLLLVSLSLISAQSRSFNHQIDKRSPEIDPYWYVGRGVRPIGRFGKRQLRNKSSLKPGLNSLLELIVSHLKQQERLDSDKAYEDGNW